MTTATASRLADAVRIGPGGKPEFTLGWQVLGWTKDYLLQPDGPNAGEPWDFTDEQALFVLWWYAVDKSGRFIYRRGMLRRMKGWGKDPVGAVISAVQFVGPCRLEAFEEEPIGGPEHTAWVQIAAVSRDQTRNTMTLFPGLFSPRAIEEYRIDLGKEIIYAHRGRCRIEAVTSSPRSLEGGRPTFTLKNETHHWLINNEGLEMAAVIARNAAKMDSRVLAISNAHNPGEDSDAERDYEAWQQIEQGRSLASGFLYDSTEAPADTNLRDRDSLRHGLECARGDSYWVPIDNLIEEIYDPRTPASTARRFYLNQINAAEDAWVAPHEWNLLALQGWRPEAGAQVALAFDGSKTDDHTALIGCEIETGNVFTLGIWDPEEHGGEIPREVIDGTVDRSFALYDVVGFLADVHPFESYIDKWEEEYARDLCVKAGMRGAIGWDMRGHLKEATFVVEAFYDAIVEEDFSHDNNPRLNQHVYNARRRPNAWGVTIGKEHRESSRKIDGAVAAALARYCRQLYLALPKSRQRRVRTGKAMFA